MSTLTDRYVWGVLRAVPEAQRRDLEPEIRALVADAVEARASGGAADTAERAALEELGDPELLAARYTDRSMVLIGPRYYGEWRRLLGLLLPIVVPIAILATTAAAALADRPAQELVGVAITTGFEVAIQLVFWITVVFAAIERSGQASLVGPWTPDRLPDLPKSKGESPAELAVAVVAMVVGAGALVWQQEARPVTIGGASYPVFDPALWSFWMPYFLALLGLELVMTLVRWRRGGWTWDLAIVNLVANLAFLVPGLYLLTNGLLFDPGLEAAVANLGIGAALQPAGVIVPVVVVASSAWDAIDGFRKAAMRSRA
jgi:hypothetical protein